MEDILNIGLKTGNRFEDGNLFGDEKLGKRLRTEYKFEHGEQEVGR